MKWQFSDVHIFLHYFVLTDHSSRQQLSIDTLSVVVRPAIAVVCNLWDLESIEQISISHYPTCPSVIV